PFFVFGQSAFAEGVGERLRPLPLAPAWYVVIEPGVSVRTADIFADARLTRNTEPIKITDFSASCDRSEDVRAALRNDLEPIVCQDYPDVAAAREWLAQYGPARMSGSGSCVFAVFASADEARRVAGWVPNGWRAWAARGLDEHPLMGFAEA
ncbi:MAG TPA: 4-(cytidine 5'-diphospho)-2-C-methyl-D-erythritol kinase, partial [Acidiferrobacterales bacterium]|nr:4-(cytidine 5'-diphospho)-2-C-methyl-D-erythritol kinase [Acidiferrobacterales bacterium]